MLFHGAPGTGKSALAAEIARRHARPVVARTASQLLSKYVGGTERNLAAAFTEAKSRGALLILDEADSFLQPRRGARRSWEVCQVNELLVQIERFEGWLVSAGRLRLTSLAARRGREASRVRAPGRDKPENRIANQIS